LQQAVADLLRDAVAPAVTVTSQSTVMAIDASMACPTQRTRILETSWTSGTERAAASTSSTSSGSTASMSRPIIWPVAYPLGANSPGLFRTGQP
jgi:hypothetical protein